MAREGPAGTCHTLAQTRHTVQILFANCKLFHEDGEYATKIIPL
jgi:hypothetical protein